MNPQAIGISVIIPCHNAERWIGRALQSVAAQTLQPREIIVIDDDSTDNSVQAIKDSGVDVALLHSTAHNGAATRNVGIEHASSDWIAFLDADDIWYPEHLERAGRLLAGTKDVAYLGKNDSFTESDPQTRRPGRTLGGCEESASGLSHLRFIEWFEQTGTFSMPGCMIRRDRLEDIGGLDESFRRRHDIDMWLRAIHGRTWTYDPVATAAFQADSPGSISRNVADAASYYYRAFARNAAGFDCPAMESVLHFSARKALAAALTDGDRQSVEQARKEVWGDLSLSDRLIFRLSLCWPGLFRWLNQRRRRRLTNPARASQ